MFWIGSFQRVKALYYTHTHYTWALAHWQLHLVSTASQPIWWWCCFFQCSSWELSYYYYMKWQANVVFIACVFEFITTHGVRSEWSWNGRRNAKCAEHPFVVALCKPHTVWHTHITRAITTNNNNKNRRCWSQMLIGHWTSTSLRPWTEARSWITTTAIYALRNNHTECARRVQRLLNYNWRASEKKTSEKK